MTARPITTATRRMLLAGGAVACATTAVHFLWWGDLPEPVASHFTLGGSPDDFLTRGANLALGSVLVLVIPLLMLAMIRMDRHFTRTSRYLGAFGVGVGAFIAALLLSVLASQRGLSDAASASFPASGLLLPLLGGTAAGTVMYWWLPTAEPEPPAGAQPPVMRLAASEQVSWSATQSNRWFLVLGAALALVGAVLIPLIEPVLGWILLTVGLLVTLTFGSVAVTVDHRGVTWSLGIGLIRGRIVLADLAQARPVDVVPTRYGGWGYRFSPLGAAIVMGAGPGITFVREGKQDFTITVPDAETGAAVANGMLAREGA